MLIVPIMQGWKILLISSIVVLAHSLSAFADETVYIQVRSSKMRSEPKFLAPAKAEVTYGQKLAVVGKPQGTWLQVKSGGNTGYVHASAVTTREIVFTKGGKAKDIPVDNSDIVVAGKGFNPQVEKEFAASNPTLNFAAVDNMERLRVADSDLRSFMSTGKLIR